MTRHDELREPAEQSKLDLPTERQVAALLHAEPQFAALLHEVAISGLPLTDYWDRFRALFGHSGDALGELLVERDPASTDNQPVVLLSRQAKQVVLALLDSLLQPRQVVFAKPGWWKGLSVEAFTVALGKIQEALPLYSELDWTHEVQNERGVVIAEVAGFEEVPADDPSPWVQAIGASPIGYIHIPGYDRLLGRPGKKFVDFGLLVEPYFQRLRRKG